jgi:hypothetical protein
MRYTHTGEEEIRADMNRILSKAVKKYPIHDTFSYSVFKIDPLCESAKVYSNHNLYIYRSRFLN